MVIILYNNIYSSSSECNSLARFEFIFDKGRKEAESCYDSFSLSLSLFNIRLFRRVSTDDITGARLQKHKYSTIGHQAGHPIKREREREGGV